MWYCQACDNKIHMEQSIVAVQGYTTCGKKKCQQWANKQAAGLQEAKVEKKAPTADLVPAMVVVFRSKPPHVQDSWEVVLPEEHPSFLLNPNVLAHMLDSGDVAQDSDVPGWHFRVLHRDVVEAAMKEARA